MPSFGKKNLQIFGNCKNLIMCDGRSSGRREVSFNKGDIIFIRRQVDNNWLEGELNGRIGIFPANYICTGGDARLGCF